MRIAPDNITSLKPNEIFVFGSNTLGRHGAGAAKQAMKWGAVYGCGIGLRGNTYALPTKDDFIETLPLDEIEEYVNGFIWFAKALPKFKFLVTQIGCGLAGFTPQDIAPLFKKALEVENIYLPKSFLDILLD